MQKLRGKAWSILTPSPTLSTQVDTDVIHVIKWTRPSSSILLTASNQKLGQWEGLETRLSIS